MRYDDDTKYPNFMLDGGRKSLLLDGTDGRPVTSIVRIKLDESTMSYEMYGSRAKDFTLYLVNPYMDLSSDFTQYRASKATIRHEWARDDENDRCSVADIELYRPIFTSAYGSEFRFKAVMGQSRFYDPALLSPFQLGLTEDETDPEKGGEHDANAGFPYMPPQVDLKNYHLRGGALVDLYIHTGGGGGLQEWYDRLKAGDDE